jgi:methylenetetrahydrofolate dehydrogenase (NADP+)/methenyltetrahydrofolate cyclohydrolase
MDTHSFATSKIISGKEIAHKNEEKLIEKVKELGQPISVVSILVGNDPPSVLYTGLKQKKATAVGITFTPITFTEDTSFDEVAEKIKELNSDSNIDGIMLQLPLPKSFLGEHTHQELTELIDPKKDIDGLTSERLVPPAAVAAVLSILESQYITVFDMPVVVMGNSDLVGKPMAKELEKMGGHVTIIDSKTENPEELTLEAALIVTAVGKPGILTGDMVHEGVVVIDIGTLVIEDQLDGEVQKKVVGDVDFESVLPKAKLITPVPGGVGPMTIIALLENCVKLKEMQND